MRYSVALLAAVLAAGVQAISPPPQYRVDIVLTADNNWKGYVKGEVFNGPTDSPTAGFAWQQVKTITKWVDPGQFIVAFAVSDMGVVGGFIANIFIDGVLVRQTAANNGWRVLYGAAPLSGWNTDTGFDDSAWAAITPQAGSGVCPENTDWKKVTPVVNANAGGAQAQWLWGPQCSSTQLTNYYRLKLETNSPVVEPPTVLLPVPKQKHRVDVVLTADNSWVAYINGETIVGTTEWYTVQNISRYVDDGPFLAAFAATDAGVVGGFIASIFVDGQVVTQTSGNSGWRVKYGQAPSSGWNTNLNYDDSAWSTVTDASGVCPADPAWFQTTPKVNVNGAQAKWLWGPQCNSILNTNYYRIKLNTNDGLARVDIAYTADQESELYLAGVKRGSDVCGSEGGAGWSTVNRVAVRVPPGPMVIAAHVKRCRSIGGFIAVISVNGCPVKVTDITALQGWRSIATLPAAGWESQINYDDSKWANIVAACPFYDAWGGLDVTLRNSCQQPMWLLGSKCNQNITESWFRVVLNVPSPLQEFKIVFTVDTPFYAVLAGKALDKLQRPVSERYTTYSLTQMVMPGYYVVAIEARHSQQFLPARGFIATVYINGRVVSATGSNRGWETLNSNPGTNWNVDPLASNVIWPTVYGSCALEYEDGAVASAQSKVRNARSDARWIKYKNCATPNDATAVIYYRLRVQVDNSTPTMTFPVVNKLETVTVTQTNTVTATNQPCSSSRR